MDSTILKPIATFLFMFNSNHGSRKHHYPAISYYKFMLETCIDVMAITKVDCHGTSKILKISLPLAQAWLNYVYLIETYLRYIVSKFGVNLDISFGVVVANVN